MKLIPNDQDDLWVIYNIIRKGDRVFSRSSREVKLVQEGTRPTEGKRVSMHIGIQVDRAIYQSYNDRLRVHGIIIDAPEKYGIKGSHHTITIDFRNLVMIVKDEWTKIELDSIKRAGKWKTTPIMIVAIDDENCSTAILRQNSLQILAEINSRLPSKREANKREAATKNYFKKVVNVLTSGWEKEQPFIAIVGPGFLKNSFAKYLREGYHRMGRKISVVGLASIGGVSGIKEALRSGVLDKITKKVRMIEEGEAVYEILRRIGSGKKSVSYGLDSVVKAVGYGAVEFLLVSNKLLRETEEEERKRLEDVMKKTERMGGSVMIIGSQHEAGAELIGLGGIAARLRYAIDTT
jgi:protein pelota